VTEQLTITRLGHRGDGVADTPAGPVYVPYTLPGEVVTVEAVAGHPDRRHLDHVDKPSHERATPVCKHFGQCGGCALQHWSLAEYHLWKRSLVVEALERAAATTSGLKPVEAIARDLFRRPFMAAELKAFDAVVFDPPRQGAEAQARELAKSKVPTVVAVSCDAATFARDARILVDSGYKLTSVTPVDQFRYSAHVELVAKFAR